MKRRNDGMVHLELAILSESIIIEPDESVIQQSCLDLATSIPINIMKNNSFIIYLRCVSANSMLNVSLPDIKRHALSN